MSVGVAEGVEFRAPEDGTAHLLTPERAMELHGETANQAGLFAWNTDQAIDNYGELDFVRNKLDADLRKKFEDKGYVLLAWGDVGPVHIFSNTPIRSRADMLATKMWAWTDDPIIRKMFDQVQQKGVPLGVQAYDFRPA